MATEPQRALHERRKMRLARWVLAGVALLLLVTACRTPGDRPAPTPAASATPRPFTVMSTDQIRVTDPAAITDAASTVLALNVFQRLMTADPGGSVLKPDAARDCLFTTATTYTCTLNDDLAFHNGHPLTSSDVKFSIERAYRLNIPGSSAAALSSLRKVQTPDEKTVRFVLSRPDTQFGWALASPAASIVDEEVYDADRVQDPDEPIIGSGPFLVTKYTGNQLQLSRYDAYVGRNPARLPALVYRSVADSPTIEDAMTRGTVDVVWRGLDSAAVTRFNQQVRQTPDHLTVNGFTESVLSGARVLQLEWSPTSPMRVKQSTAPSDRGRAAGRPYLRLHRSHRRGGAYFRLSARRQGVAQGDLEEPHQPDTGVRRLDAQWPGPRDADSQPTGEHRRTERAAQAR